MTDPARPELTWNRHSGDDDLACETAAGDAARVTIHRSEVGNAFCPQAVRALPVFAIARMHASPRSRA